MNNAYPNPIKTATVMFCLLITLFAVLLNPASALAHQSGCHRWHSCPSDSGSYICGDTGYTSGCDDSSPYIAPAVDYATQGRSNGESHARINDLSYIESNAQTSGSNDGTTDGNSGVTELARPEPDATCGRVFTFDTPQDPLYVSNFESTYRDTCTILFSRAYSSAYSNAYTLSVATRKTQEAEKKKADENTVWGWVISSGIIIWVIHALAKKK